MSEAVVRYKFVATGADSIVAAFKGISRAAEDSAVRVQRAQSRSMPGGGGVGGGGSRSRGNDVAKLAERVARDQEKAAQREVRAVEAAERAKTRAVEREAAVRARIYAREAEVQAHNTRQRVQNVAKMAGSGIGTVAKIAGGGLVGGAAVLGAAAKEAMALDTIANQLARNARMSGGAGSAKVDQAAIRQQLIQTAVANKGIKSEDLGAAMVAYQGKTGEIASASMQDMFAKSMLAGDISGEDIAAVAANLRDKLGIKSEKDMGDAIATLMSQGAQGTFEMKDMAALFERIGAAAQGVGYGQGVGGVRKLGGLMQVIRGATGSREQAATGVENLFSALVAHQKQIGAGPTGTQVFADKAHTRLRDVTDIVTDIIVKKKGDIGAIQATVGDKQAYQAMQPLVSAYNAATGGKTDKASVEAGRKAISDALERAAGNVSHYSDVLDAAAMASEKDSAALTAAWEQIKGAAAEKLLPIFSKMVDSGAIDTAIGAFESLAEVVANVADAMGMLVDMLGISGLRTGTGDIDSAGRKAAAKVRRLEAKGELTADEKAELATAKGTVAHTKEQQAFIEQYVKLGTRGSERDRRIDAANLVNLDPSKMLGESESVLNGVRIPFRSTIENQAQERLTREYALRQGASQTLGGDEQKVAAVGALRGDSGVQADVMAAFKEGGAGAAMAKVAASAERAASALSKIEANARPSIVSGG